MEKSQNRINRWSTLAITLLIMICVGLIVLHVAENVASELMYFDDQMVPFERIITPEALPTIWPDNINAPDY